ncbi:MAG: hypothetical protein H7Y89_16875 [Steroidobacteraceae bacterium]|nr:hypothetical protein [Steroidobacteraceae bacterium]
MSESPATQSGGPLQGQAAGYFVLVNQRDPDDGLDIREVVGRIASKWKLLLVAAVLGAAVSASILFFVRDQFLSVAVVVPVTQSAGGASALNSQFGGLAALAGIDLGAGDRSRESFATLTSRGLAREFILQNNLIPILFAEKWDAKAKDWRAGVRVPNSEDAVNLYLRKVCTIAEDKKNNVVTVAIRWYDPELAARWANGMIDMVNDRKREEAISESKQSIEFLRRELAQTNMIELQQSIYRLIETQIGNAMLANVQRAYAFRVIDRAVPPKKKAAPQRTLMTLLGGFLGAALLAAFLFVRFSLEHGARRI